mmetsp:Transcript_26521/g.4630  ORF Transcript_26521/g.4630 Transcript_26521/m.4630 type:complete len:128 (+) Transcript_26521:1783-2166(+)
MLGEISEDVTTTEFYTDPPYLMASTRIYCTRVSSIERVEIGCSSVIGLRKGLCKSMGYDIEDIFGKGRGLQERIPEDLTPYLYYTVGIVLDPDVEAQAPIDLIRKLDENKDILQTYIPELDMSKTIS